MSDVPATERQLTAKQLAFVAAYVGAARGNASEAARIAGYVHPGQQGFRLLKNVQIDSAIQVWREEIRSTGLATLEQRVTSLATLEDKLQSIISQRAESATDDIPGDDTGLIVKREKVIGTGRNAVHTTEYEVDTGTIQQIRAIYDDIAKELGQRVERIETTGQTTSVHIVGITDAEIQR